MEDSVIVGRFLERDERALSDCEEKYGARLRMLAQNITDTREDAEECVNDGLLAAWNKIPPAEPREYLFAFLARAVRCAAFDLCRRRGRQKRAGTIVELSDELCECLASSAEVEQAEGKDIAAALNSFLDTLGHTERVVFLRRYWYMEPVSRVAVHCHMSENRVKVMLHRTRGKLRTWLAEKEVFL